VTIGSSVASIGQNAFQGCSALTTIIIPASVTSIDSNAFQSSGLTNNTVNIASASATALGISASPPTVAFYGANNVNVVIF